MRKRLPFLIFLFIWFGLTAVGSVSADQQLKASPEPNQDIPVGERLTYQITWLRIPVAVGELWAKEKTTLNGREVIHVIGIIETNKVLKKIFPMHDEAHSWIDAKTLESVQFEKNVNEIKEKTHEKVMFDAAAKKGYYESFTTGEKKEFDITLPVYDVLSAIYWARRQSLSSGESVKTMLVANEKDWKLEIKVLRKERVKFNRRKIDTFRVEPNTVSEGVSRRGMAYFNVTKDSSRIPVRGVYKAPFGKVIGTLKKIQTPLGLYKTENHES